MTGTGARGTGSEAGGREPASVAAAHEHGNGATVPDSSVGGSAGSGGTAPDSSGSGSAGSGGTAPDRTGVGPALNHAAAPGRSEGYRAVSDARDGALLVVGDVVTDVIARHRGPLASGTDTAAAIRTVPGGAGANVACWAAYWGCADVRLLGRVGTDTAAWHERELTASGVRPCLVVDPQAPTGTVICLVDTGAAAERTFLTDSCASLRLEPDDWSDTVLDGVARLHLSGYLLFSERGRALVTVALESARARGVPVSLDPASAGFLAALGVDRFLALVEGVDILLPSHDEACLLTGLPDGADAAAKLSRHVPLVVAKQGTNGALVARSGAVSAHVPAVPATPRDTTGAGDAFTGAFLSALLSGAGPEDAAREGCRAGALAVERVGGRPPRPE